MKGVRWLQRKLRSRDADTNAVGELSVNALLEEKKRVRATVKLKRDRHDDLERARERLFERVMAADDRLLQRELAGEIAAIEDEMAILQDEHAELMDSLQVIDGLLAVKRRERMVEHSGLIDRIREMSQESLVEAMRRQDVQQMVQEERWDELNVLLGDHVSTGASGRERPDEILEQAADVRQLSEQVGTEH